MDGKGSSCAGQRPRVDDVRSGLAGWEPDIDNHQLGFPTGWGFAGPDGFLAPSGRRLGTGPPP